MADLIDHDALGVSLFPLGKKDAADIYKLIMGAPAVNRWIPVEDALPKIGYSVLVTRKTESNTRYIRIASRQDDCWMDNTDKYGKPNPHQVLAWMPMPDAYEQSKSEVWE